MSTIEIRTEVHQMIDEVDETLLKAIHAMLGAYQKELSEDPIIGYSQTGKPMYASTAREAYQKRYEAVDQGSFITLEDLKKESQTWLKGNQATQ
jgi:hypothetical protein